MASPFQRTSSFDQPQGAPTLPSPRKESAKVVSAPSAGPSREDIEHWYRVTNDLLVRESEGDVDHTRELEDLRDGIYAFLH